MKLLMFIEKHNLNPTEISNLSSGLKSFVLIKYLLENEVIKEKDVLILDEPEIHLHPEWQIKYAEIIVLLQKFFNLSIVVTTHSRDFFEALELFSKKYSIIDRCKIYLSVNCNQELTFVDLQNDYAEVYRQLIKPSDILDKLRFSIEDGEE